MFFQERVGRYKKPFVLVKFRTMKLATIAAPTHTIESSAVTRLGRVLRRSKLDELPQLWNVLRGDMSLVGPRPCLPSQSELIIARDHFEVFSVRPGITGLSQINGIDMSNPKALSESDAKMIKTMSLKCYLGYILSTIFGAGRGDRIISQK